jgi:hypothetical protein
MCVLFPVVSITDDLNVSPAEPETVKSQLALLPHFLLGNSAWALVYDPHESTHRYDVDEQPDYSPPAHSFLSFLLKRRPPPQFA